MRVFIAFFILTIGFFQQAKAQATKLKFKSPEEQVDHRTLKPTKAQLLKYSGDYIPNEKDIQLIPMSIVLKEDGYIYRRLSNDMDRQAIPQSATKFIYADGSGRTLEFVSDADGNVIHVILSRPDGVFILKKV